MRPVKPLLMFGLILQAGIATAASDPATTRVAMKEKSAATFYVSTDIAGVGTTEFLVDTGSGYATINEVTLKALKRTGNARFVRNLRGVMADGSKRQVPVYLISGLSIGSECWLPDIEVAVFPGKSRQILGLSALRKASPFVFSVDPPELQLSQCGHPATGASAPSS
jgi:hypothetical protein